MPLHLDVYVVPYAAQQEMYWAVLEGEPRVVLEEGLQLSALGQEQKALLHA
jgi:hypothetical protein